MLLVPRQGAAQRPVLLPDRLDRREVLLARHRGLPLGRAARGHVGGRWSRSGARATCGYAKQIFETAFAMQDAVQRAPRAADHRLPDVLLQLHVATSSTSTTSTTSCGRRGWRFNGQQYPNAIHMAVTRPQTQPGVVDAFATDLDEAVAYAKEHAGEAPEERRDLRRHPRRPDRRGRELHRGRDGRHDGRAAGPPARRLTAFSRVPSGGADGVRGCEAGRAPCWRDARDRPDHDRRAQPGEPRPDRHREGDVLHRGIDRGDHDAETDAERPRPGSTARPPPRGTAHARDPSWPRARAAHRSRSAVRAPR